MTTAVEHWPPDFPSYPHTLSKGHLHRKENEIIGRPEPIDTFRGGDNFGQTDPQTQLPPGKVCPSTGGVEGGGPAGGVGARGDSEDEDGARDDPVG